MEVPTEIIVSALAIALGIIVTLTFRSKDKNGTYRKQQTTGQKSNVTSGPAQSTSTAKNKQKQQVQAQQQQQRPTKRNDNKNYNHPWLLTSLKGHTGQVFDMDFSSNGKYLATCSEDKTILLWCTKELETSKDRRSLRVNVEYDFATKVKWSPDNKALCIHKSLQNCIEVYKIEKKEGWFTQPTKAITFPKKNDDEIIGFGMSCTGRFMMTCTNRTNLIVWDLKGNILEELDTYLMSTNCAKISPCGRFIAATGFTSDAKLWEVKFNKAGEYVKTTRAFELCGHTSGIYDIAFDQNTAHIATVSKDGTWKLYNTKIEYENGESPHILITAPYETAATPSLIALSMYGEVVAISSGADVLFYSAITGVLDMTIENVFNNGIITAITFDPLGKYLLVAGERQIRVFHNVTGYKVAIEVAKKKLKENLTSATRERIEKQIADDEEFLKNY